MGLHTAHHHHTTPPNQTQLPSKGAGGSKIQKKDWYELAPGTLKVEEEKVSLVFLFKVLEPRYGHILILHVFPFHATL